MITKINRSSRGMTTYTALEMDAVVEMLRSGAFAAEVKDFRDEATIRMATNDMPLGKLEVPVRVPHICFAALWRKRKGMLELQHYNGHFYDKSTYPLPALSFFNLVPSCHECNHGKLGKVIGVNPYFKGIESKLSIASTDDIPRIMDANELWAVKGIADFCLVFDRPSENEKKNIKNLGLAVLYNEHKDYVMEIIDKTVTYDHCLEEGIVDNFQGVFHNPQEIHNLILGQYFVDENHEKRPLSKLTNDILEQLNIK